VASGQQRSGAALAYGDNSRGRSSDGGGTASRGLYLRNVDTTHGDRRQGCLQTDVAVRSPRAANTAIAWTCTQDLVGEVGKTTRCEVVMSADHSFEPVISVTGVDGSAINFEMAPGGVKEQLEKAVSRLVHSTRRGSPSLGACESRSGRQGRRGGTAPVH